MRKRPSTIFSMTRRGLAGFLRLLGQHGALALDQRLVEALDVDGLRVGGGDMHGDLLAEGSSSFFASPFDSSATMTPILPSPGAMALCM